MQYEKLPPVGMYKLPPLFLTPSMNASSRGGRHPRLIFVHTWGGGTFNSVIDWLCNPHSQASAHIVYGGVQLNKTIKTELARQLVPFHLKAWTQCDLNPVAISIESNDLIWSGHAPASFAQLARIVAFLCHKYLGVCRYVSAEGIVHGMAGFTRHADAGALGCGHLHCPTTDAELWGQFSHRVIEEYRLGGFRQEWGKQ